MSQVKRYGRFAHRQAAAVGQVGGQDLGGPELLADGGSLGMIAERMPITATTSSSSNKVNAAGGRRRGGIGLLFGRLGLGRLGFGRPGSRPSAHRSGRPRPRRLGQFGDDHLYLARSRRTSSAP